MYLILNNMLKFLFFDFEMLYKSLVSKHNALVIKAKSPLYSKANAPCKHLFYIL